MIVAGLVTMVCALVFVLAVGLGVRERWMYGAIVFGTAVGVVALVRRIGTALQRLRPVPLVISLAGVQGRALDSAVVGAKAKMLARLATAGVRVPPSWVLTAAAFREHARAAGVQDEPAGSPAVGDAIREARVPPLLLAQLHHLLESTPHASFVVRSSFVDEDSAERAFPGVYESVVWARSQGLEALENALRHVWASYWGPRALAYGAGRAGVVTGDCTLPILLCARIEHWCSGFASSAEVATGYREHHLVEGVDGERRGWTYRHDLLTSRLELIGGDREEDARWKVAARAASELAAMAEALAAMPMEVEWGHVEGRLWAYQARPLTSLPAVATLTNSHVVELPRRPLTPLSRWFLFGTEPPARLFNRGLERLGLPPLTDDDVVFHHGAPWLRVDSCKRYLTRIDGFTAEPGAAARVMRLVAAIALRGARSLAIPEPPRPPKPAAPASLFRRLERLRTRRLVPLVEREIVILQLAAVAEDLVHRAWRDGGAPPPALGDAQPSAAWYHCVTDAELAVPRRGELGAAEPAARRRRRAGDGAVGGPRRRLLLRMRDGLLAERERLKMWIAVTNFEARQLVLALSARLAADVHPWSADDVFFLSGDDLARYLAGHASPAELCACVERNRRDYDGWQRTELPPVLHLDHEGTPIVIAARDGDVRVLAWGVPLGNGSASGPACLISVRHGDERPCARGRVVVLPDPDIRWEPFVAEAAAVVFVRGGPLSHLAILCRERGIPGVAGADLAALVRDGERIEVDGVRGEVRRAD
jgi:phosphohistidine swiveling domain-containing protein